jgi:hypothetical protein
MKLRDVYSGSRPEAALRHVCDLAALPGSLLKFAVQQRVEALTSVIGPNVKCMQSMFFIKHAGRPGHSKAA